MKYFSLKFLFKIGNFQIFPEKIEKIKKSFSLIVLFPYSDTSELPVPVNIIIDSWKKVTSEQFSLFRVHSEMSLKITF